MYQPRIRKLDARLVVYLVHLMVPALLLGDLGWAWLSGYFSGGSVRGPEWLAAGAAAWLIAGLGALSMSRDRQKLLRKMTHPLLSFYTTLVMLMVAELAIGAFMSRTQDRRIFPRPPRSKTVVLADSRTTPGCNGRKVFSVNDVGLRGPSLPAAENRYRIVAAGGSTTECFFLDDTEEWPHLLMNEMNSRQTRRHVWVGNGGFSGHTTVHTLALLKTVPVLGKADMLIFLAGINDLQATLESEGKASERDLESAAQGFFSPTPIWRKPGHHAPLYLRSKIYQIIHSLVAPTAITGSWYGRSREVRAKAQKVPLPDLEVGLAEYQNRIVRIARECQARRSRCVFLTQPTMWRENLTADEEKLLWMGWIGPMQNPTGYVPAAQLAKAMDLYNQRLIETCGLRGLDCYDLASVVPKDTSALFDDCHFNEQGARIVADRLSQYLLSRPPFVAGTDPIARVGTGAGGPVLSLPHKRLEAAR
jgi:lysophospholipase L1-like esterase